MERHALARPVAGFILLLAGCAHFGQQSSQHPPIVFVHGAGGDAARWTTTLWRFESNGWPRDRLFAFDLANPFAPDEFDKPQPARSTSADHTAQVAAEVERVLKVTGADKVVLVANSRGGLAVRDYIRNGDGKRRVSHAILGGTPNRGIWNSPDFRLRGEFNAAGPYLKALNAPQGPEGLEVTPGVAFMTIRSDTLDKWMQPDGRWLGDPKLKTNVTFDSGELKGAENIVLPGADHLEVSYGPQAFAHTYRFITGKAPATTAVVPEATVVLDGKITSANPLTNTPLMGASVEVHEVACATGERLGAAAHVKTTGPDGMWGPFAAKPTACYEFVAWAADTARNHVYRSPFPRSSAVQNIRLQRLGDADRKAASVLYMVRPRGFFATGRTVMRLDGKDPPGIGPGVPGLNQAVLRLPEPAARTVFAEYDGERIAMKTWPASENRVVRAEFHY